MGREETLTAVREKYPQYADMADDALGTALAAKFPQYADLAPKAGKPEPAPVSLKNIVQGALDTFSDKPLGGAKEHTIRRPVDVVYKPEGTLEHLAQIAITAPTIAAGGMGAGALATRMGAPALIEAAAPVVGRALTSGAFAGAEKGAKGGTAWDIAKSAVTDAALSAGTEGVIGTVLKKPGAAVRAFKNATEAPVGEALSQAEQRVGKSAWMTIPSISKSPITAREAAESLQKLEGSAYTVRLEEIATEMNRVQAKAGIAGPKAGDLFRQLVSDKRYTPNFGARFIEAVRTNPLARGLADTPVEGFPLGALAIGAGADKFGDIAKHIIPHAVIP